VAVADLEVAEALAAAEAVEDSGDRERVVDAEDLATGAAIRLSSGIAGPTTTGSPVRCFIESAIQR